MSGYAGSPPKGHRFWRASEAPTLVLRFDKDVENENNDGPGWEPEMRRRYAEQGRRICTLLSASLPGGLFDALAGAMLERKASLLIIAHDRGPGPTIQPPDTHCDHGAGICLVHQGKKCEWSK